MNKELEAKVAKSIERLKAFEPPEGYYLAFSGGKDSVVCKALLDMAGCKYEAVYRVTSADPPELVRFIRDNHPDVKREVPRDKDGKPITMWNLIPRHNTPPTRVVRYCCRELKESGGDGRMTVTGVRWAESLNRRKKQGIVTLQGKKSRKEINEDDENFRQIPKGGIVLVNDNEGSRRIVEQCYKRHKTTVNPIIDWTDEEVWEFIRKYNIPYCSLYDEGWHRLGCIGCPLSARKERERELARWPKYKDAYLRAFSKIKWKSEAFRGATAQDIFNWWMEYDVLPGQMSFDEMEEGEWND